MMRTDLFRQLDGSDEANNAKATAIAHANRFPSDWEAQFRLCLESLGWRERHPAEDGES